MDNGKHKMKKTKIVATLGPATAGGSKILQLAKNGVNVFRLNFSHGDYTFFSGIIASIKKVRALGHTAAIMQDLQGPKIRVGKIPAPVTLKKNEKVIISCAGKFNAGADIKIIPIDVPILYKYVKKGSEILINDGMVQIKVVSVDIAKKEILCCVTAGGDVAGRKGVNLPGIILPISSMSKKDRQDLEFGLKNSVDIVCLSFVRRAADLVEMKKLIKKLNPKNTPLIIAKIEKPEAVKDIKAILAEADGIMVARGDLAVEAGYANIPEYQKKLIKAANSAGKIVIVATQMLESMINNPYPGRAEITDVYNAVVDGADAVMLSGETSMGRYPEKSVTVMSDILQKAEENIEKSDSMPVFIETDHDCENVISYGAALSGRVLKNSVISVCACGLNDIRYVSDYRPKNMIAAVTQDKNLFYKLAMYHGVVPVYVKNNTPEKAAAAVKKCFPNARNIVFVDFHGRGGEKGRLSVFQVNKKG